MWSRYLNVTDGRTDGRTDRRHAISSPRSALASRGKNRSVLCQILEPFIYSTVQSVIRMTHAPETGAENRLHFSGAGFWNVCICCVHLGSETRISQLVFPSRKSGVLAEFRVSHLEIRHFRLQWNDISYWGTCKCEFPSTLECSNTNLQPDSSGTRNRRRLEHCSISKPESGVRVTEMIIHHRLLFIFTHFL